MLSPPPATPAPPPPPPPPATERLSEAEMAAACEIEACYLEFFNFLPFKRGWKQPPFPRARAAAHFRSASRVVALVRSRELAKGFQLRSVDGAARDWMHSAGDVPMSTRAFRDGLVHETFKDGAGYVDGLSHARVAAYIDAYAPLAADADDDAGRAPEALDTATSKARSRLKPTKRAPPPQSPLPNNPG